MRVVLHKVSEAKVEVDGKVVGVRIPVPQLNPS